MNGIEILSISFQPYIRQIPIPLINFIHFKNILRTENSLPLLRDYLLSLIPIPFTNSIHYSATRKGTHLGPLNLKYLALSNYCLQSNDYKLTKHGNDKQRVLVFKVNSLKLLDDMAELSSTY
ncbi:unnamed protein product [Lactuca saligna]|uniref:Uncharacterized protein n=1 Tax=Lactuca saligna TaxID=75948 RepID=A0AA36E0S0_LACSI|nr:unnamed protein product [Lactuca saligna]